MFQTRTWTWTCPGHDIHVPDTNMHSHVHAPDMDMDSDMEFIFDRHSYVRCPASSGAHTFASVCLTRSSAAQIAQEGPRRCERERRCITMLPRAPTWTARTSRGSYVRLLRLIQGAQLLSSQWVCSPFSDAHRKHGASYSCATRISA